MEDDPLSLEYVALIGVLFEAFLVVLAILLGWFFGHPPAQTFSFGWGDLAWGLLATIPPLGLFWLCLKCPWGPFARLTSLVDERLLPLFSHCGVLEIAAISLVAGIGEEMLFRGLLQGGLAEAIGTPAGTWIALVLASLVFGLVHPLSGTYVLLTGLIGLYLGWSWIVSGNLLVPITAHAAYDFLALLYLLGIRPEGGVDGGRSGYSD
ncbi:MAG TPA: CPBP family intramembrane metalloprotease [Planctomycetaceae bacterium]|nr:CPBP family intramembrane metalloprotease [Planctomycetaceae bacterium]